MTRTSNFFVCIIHDSLGFLGHYCPMGSSYPIRVPVGSFSSQPGAIVPTLCFPGTYTPVEGTITCRNCPAGYSCQGYGNYGKSKSFDDINHVILMLSKDSSTFNAILYIHIIVPRICGKGRYRSLADATACKLCPTGTYSPFIGGSDISHCLPCPKGRVCGTKGMSSLHESKSCDGGFVCSSATDLSNQYENKCPAGEAL